MKTLYVWATAIAVWAIYFLLTIGERAAFLIGKRKGMQVKKIEHGLFSMLVTFDPSHAPSRRYMTWAEFRLGWIDSRLGPASAGG